MTVAKVLALHIKAGKIVAREIVIGIWEAIVPHLGDDHARITARTQMCILILRQVEFAGIDIVFNQDLGDEGLFTERLAVSSFHRRLSKCAHSLQRRKKMMLLPRHAEHR